MKFLLCSYLKKKLHEIEKGKITWKIFFFFFFFGVEMETNFIFPP